MHPPFSFPAHTKQARHGARDNRFLMFNDKILPSSTGFVNTGEELTVHIIATLKMLELIKFISLLPDLEAATFQVNQLLDRSRQQVFQPRTIFMSGLVSAPEQEETTTNAQPVTIRRHAVYVKLFNNATCHILWLVFRTCGVYPQ